MDGTPNNENWRGKYSGLSNPLYTTLLMQSIIYFIKELIILKA